MEVKEAALATLEMPELGFPRISKKILENNHHEAVRRDHFLRIDYNRPEIRPFYPIGLTEPITPEKLIEGMNRKMDPYKKALAKKAESLHSGKRTPDDYEIRSSEKDSQGQARFPFILKYHIEGDGSFVVDSFSQGFKNGKNLDQKEDTYIKLDFSNGKKELSFIGHKIEDKNWILARDQRPEEMYPLKFLYTNGHCDVSDLSSILLEGDRISIGRGERDEKRKELTRYTYDPRTDRISTYTRRLGGRELMEAFGSFLEIIPSFKKVPEKELKEEEPSEKRKLKTVFRSFIAPLKQPEKV